MRGGYSFFIILLLAFASCKPGATIEDNAEARAEYHMQIADSLESLQMLRGAALEYKLVAELYPNTSHFPNAVRNTALLYSNPANPAADDSLSLQWFQTYLTLPISRDERVKAEIYVTMLKRITTLRRELNRRAVLIDSLQVVARKQSADLAARTRRVQEVESELKKTLSELKRLRDVDARINRRKGGK
ncbi:MAG: hypothetical protein C4326_09530 [Ignavibacteria bacterium]